MHKVSSLFLLQNPFEIDKQLHNKTLHADEWAPGIVQLHYFQAANESTATVSDDIFEKTSGH